MTFTDPRPSGSRSNEVEKARSLVRSRQGRAVFIGMTAASGALLLAISIHLAGSSWLIAVPIGCIAAAWTDTLVAAHFIPPRPSIRERSSLAHRIFGFARALWGALLFGLTADYAVLADRYVGKDGVNSAAFAKAAEEISTTPVAIAAALLVSSTTLVMAENLAAATEGQRHDAAERVATLL